MSHPAGNFLVLYPKNPLWAPEDMGQIVHALRKIGFLGNPREPMLFDTGPEYLSLITYLGCSPNILTGESENATAVRMCGIFDLPRFMHGENLKPPRCPSCRKPLEKPEATVVPEQEQTCSHCGFSASGHKYDWRHSAAYGRVFIEISNVFESEAVPGEMLTDCLSQATGEVWDYCYLRRG